VVGESAEEVEDLIHAAVAFHIDGLREHGLPVSEPLAQAARVDVA
jgi:predicted RNase H-like HicB family nuclease